MSLIIAGTVAGYFVSNLINKLSPQPATTESFTNTLLTVIGFGIGTGLQIAHGEPVVKVIAKLIKS